MGIDDDRLLNSLNPSMLIRSIVTKKPFFYIPLLASKSLNPSMLIRSIVTGNMWELAKFLPVSQSLNVDQVYCYLQKDDNAEGYAQFKSQSHHVDQVYCNSKVAVHLSGGPQLTDQGYSKLSKSAI